jgi:hypothetical protein
MTAAKAKARAKTIATIAPGLRPFDFFEIYFLVVGFLVIIVLLFPPSKLTSKISSSSIKEIASCKSPLIFSLYLQFKV